MHSAHVAVVLIALLVCAAIALPIPVVSDDDPDYDSQTETYQSQFEPVTISDKRVSLSMFFSPDTSASTLVPLLEEAQESIDIATPGFSSWSGCSSVSAECTGCDVEKQRNKEKFPIFGLLLNKLHQGVKVRILTNNFHMTNCEHKIDPILFLLLNGAEVHFFNSLTFMHSKYIVVDGKHVSISSINFTQSSFRYNREAGIILKGSKPLIEFTKRVFDYDFEKGDPMVLVDPSVYFNSTEMDVILDPSDVPYVLPSPAPSSVCAQKSPAEHSVFESIEECTVMTSPDFAYDHVMSDLLNGTKKSLKLSIYQITQTEFCDAMIELKNRGIDLQLFVSYHIFGTGDFYEAHKCYEKLHANGVKIQMSNHTCLRYWHQKYWIIDSETVFLSTGNWSPTDFPTDPPTFVPYNDPSKAWRKTNRDFTLKIRDARLVSFYEDFFQGDFVDGQPYEPSAVYEREHFASRSRWSDDEVFV